MSVNQNIGLQPPALQTALMSERKTENPVVSF